jgi:protein subunit release factor A
MERKMELLFSVTKKDFDIQTFTVPGPGGGGKDTSNTGVRLIHRDSGAVGEGREHRSNSKNREAAFKKLVNSKNSKIGIVLRLHVAFVNG